MIDTSNNQFETAASKEELKEQIPEDAWGPMFEIGETLIVKGYIWEVKILDQRGMFLKPIGPVIGRQAKRLRNRGG